MISNKKQLVHGLTLLGKDNVRIGMSAFDNCPYKDSVDRVNKYLGFDGCFLNVIGKTKGLNWCDFVCDLLPEVEQQKDRYDCYELAYAFDSQRDEFKILCEEFLAS